MTRKGLAHGDGFLTVRNGKYQARWKDGGTWRAKTFTEEEDAKDHLREIARHKRRGTYTSPSTMTVADVLTEYLNRPSQRMSENTLYTYRTRERTMIRPFMGQIKVAQLRTIDVQRWLDGLTNAEYAPSTIQPALAVLSAAMKEAKRLGLIAHDPTEGVRRPSIPRKQMQTWTEDEARRVLETVRGDERFEALYHLALATGMRPGELRALKWPEIDMDKALVRVRSTLTKDVAGCEHIIGRTKTDATRVIATNQQVLHVLKWHKTRQVERRLVCGAAWNDLAIVFDRGDGHWLGQPSWRKEHIRICGAAGVPVIRLHDMRHFYATHMLEHGVHPKIVAEVLGHSSIQMTLDRYSHVSIDLQRVALAALDGLFSVECDVTPGLAANDLTDSRSGDTEHRSNLNSRRRTIDDKAANG